MKDYSGIFYKALAKCACFFILLLSLAHGKASAQVSLGIDTSATNFAYYAKDTAYYGDTAFLTFNVRNYGNQVYNGTVVIMIAVDSVPGGAVILDTMAMDSINVTGLAAFSTVYDSLTPTISNSAFRPGINTVVIWPRAPLNNPTAFTTHDSLFYDIAVLGYSGIRENGRLETLVFPNPFQDRLYILNKNGSVERVRILDGLGRTIYAEDFKGYIDVKQLPPGVYIIEFSGNTGETARYKAIKE